MYREKGSIAHSFDEAYVKRTSKADFLKAQAHHADSIDLEAVWDKHNTEPKDSPAAKDKDKHAKP